MSLHERGTPGRTIRSGVRLLPGSTRDRGKPSTERAIVVVLAGRAFGTLARPAHAVVPPAPGSAAIRSVCRRTSGAPPQPVEHVWVGFAPLVAVSFCPAPRGESP
jgi:hypothetical protein